ncbi:MAG: hypothetical protein JKY33_10510 [Bacteroidia bacterium]|nr:hypothetical protein [Bacteroidia bacterium]
MEPRIAQQEFTDISSQYMTDSEKQEVEGLDFNEAIQLFKKVFGEKRWIEICGKLKNYGEKVVEITINRTEIYDFNKSNDHEAPDKSSIAIEVNVTVNNVNLSLWFEPGLTCDAGAITTLLTVDLEKSTGVEEINDDEVFQTIRKEHGVQKEFDAYLSEHYVDPFAGKLAINEGYMDANSEPDELFYKLFYRLNADGNAVILDCEDGEAICRMRGVTWIYPVDSEFSCAYEHAEGIVLTVEDAAKLHIEIEI